MKQIIRTTIFILLLSGGFAAVASAQTKPSQRSLKSQMEEINKRKQYRTRVMQNVNKEKRAAEQSMRQPASVTASPVQQAPATQLRTDTTRVRRSFN